MVTQDCGPIEEELTEAFHFDSKIVGVQYYKGTVLAGQFVRIIREPSNPYDKNALRVDNLRGIQVGHIPRVAAATLSSLIEKGDCTIEGSVLGPKQTYMIPLRIHVLALPENHDNIKNILADKLLNAKQRKTLKNAPQFNREESEFTNFLSRGIKFKPESRSKVLEIFGGELLTDLASEKDLASMPIAEQPIGLKTGLLSYQLQGLAWLKDKENPQSPRVNSPSQFWELQRHEGREYYVNLISQTAILEPPILCKGGILGDDMGLGKTIQVISLILSDLKYAPPNSVVRIDDNTSLCSTTLIVCPLSVLENWRMQIEAHVQPGILSLYVAHGPERNMCPDFLTKFDVVITTYNVIAQYASKKPPCDEFMSIKWKRAILDEGHIIRGLKTYQSQAAFKLEAESRFIISGTPIQNSLFDLYSLLKFLRFAPLDQLDIWNSKISRPIRDGQEDGITLLKNLMHLLTLRRRKEMKFDGKPIINLPNRQETLFKLEFKYDLEKQMHEALLAEFQRKYTVFADPSAPIVNYACVLEVLMRLRQCCNATNLVGERGVAAISLAEAMKITGNAALNLNDKRIKKLLKVLWENSGDECAICLDSLENTAITPCAHYFCSQCILTIAKEADARCPMCRSSISEKSIVALPDKPQEEEEEVVIQDEFSGNCTTERNSAQSTKIDALRDLLTGFLARDPTTKAVVFSQWTSMLDLVGAMLRENSISFIRFDGSLSRKKRDKAVGTFQNSDIGSPRVFLASLKSACFGINLTAANKVLLIDSWWNGSVEDQAVDRIYRLGQKRAVDVIRLMIKGSVEERVAEIQSRKRKLAAEAFGEKELHAGKEGRLSDLKDLYVKTIGQGISVENRAKRILDEDAVRSRKAVKYDL